MKNKRELVEVSVAAKMLNVSDRTIRRYLKDENHALKEVRIAKRTVRVCKKSIEMLMHEGVFLII